VRLFFERKLVRLNTYMKIIIKTTKIKLTPAIKAYVREKINSLERFAEDLFDKEYFNHLFGKGKPRVEAWIEIGKTTKHHKKGPIFFAECQMRFPGKSIRSETKRENLKLAITEVKDKLQRELNEYKEKIIAQQERKMRRAKRDLKVSSKARFYRKGRIREEGI
jgi:ribosomal subunit interface protein